MLKKINLLVILLSLFFITGCWDYNELNHLAICSGMAIDKEGDKYKVSLMISNSKKYQLDDEGNEADKVVYSGVGKTIDEAIDKINLESLKKIYIGHLSIVLVSEEIAGEGLLNIMDYLVRNPESTKEFLLAIVKDNKALEALEAISPMATYSSLDLTTNLKVASELQSISTDITFNKFMENYITKGINPILPTVTIEKNLSEINADIDNSTTDTISKLSTIAIFKDDKLVTYANEIESMGINILTGNAKKLLVTTKCENEYVTAEIGNIYTKLKITYKNNTPEVLLNFSGDGAIEELMCKLDIRKPKNINILNKKISSEINKIINSGYILAQKNKTDIFGIGNLTYRKYPKYFNNISYKWDNEIFPNIKLNIKINLNLKSKGSLEQTIEEAKNGK